MSEEKIEMTRERFEQRMDDAMKDAVWTFQHKIKERLSTALLVTVIAILFLIAAPAFVLFASFVSLFAIKLISFTFWSVFLVKVAVDVVMTTKSSLVEALDDGNDIATFIVATVFFGLLTVIHFASSSDTTIFSDFFSWAQDFLSILVR
jgi:hypothetical protein